MTLRQTEVWDPTWAEFLARWELSLLNVVEAQQGAAELARRRRHGLTRSG